MPDSRVSGSSTSCTQQEQKVRVELGAEIEGVREGHMEFGIDDVIPVALGLGQNENTVVFALELPLYR